MKPIIFRAIGLLTAVFAGLFLVATPAIARDNRLVKLGKFLSTRNQQLSYLAPEFVRQADKYGLDYRLLPAISGVESTFGQEYIRGSYNIYGWGGGLLYFESWGDGIEKLASGLKTNYVDRGASTVEQIGYIYNPPNPERWAANVRYFMNQIEATDISDGLLPAPEEIKLTLTI